MSTSRQAPSSLKLLAIIGAIIFAMSAAFGFSTWRAHGRFSAHRAAWSPKAASVDACRTQVLDWAHHCNSLDSWCEAAIPDLMRECLALESRTAYCQAQGDEIKSTRFGFAACKPLYEHEADRYRKRRTKKYCALTFRALAGYCEKLPTQVQ